MESEVRWIKNIELTDDKLIKLKTLHGYRERLINAKKTIQVPANELKNFMTKNTLGNVINDNIKLVDVLNRKIKKVDVEMARLIESDSNLIRYYQLSISVPGVGPQTAIYFIITTKAYTTFSSWKKLACYSGVAPFEYSSGSSIRGRTKVSQIANKKAKSLLGMAAINSIRCDKQLKYNYQRKIAEGKNPMSVVNAVRNKVLARLFATVKRGTPFVPVSNYLN